MSDSSPATPILIAGMARSGTTWTSNVLRGALGLYTPSHPLHYGIKEPNLLQMERLRKRIGDDAEFLKQIADSDNVRLLSADPAEFVKIRFETYYDLFFTLMDRRAAEHSTAWFTKVCPEIVWFPDEREHFLRAFRARYHTEPRWIVVRRSVQDCLASYLLMPGSRRESRMRAGATFPALVLAMARYNALYAAAGHLPGALDVAYENLRDHLARTTAEIAAHLGVPLSPTDEAPPVRNASERTRDFPVLAFRAASAVAALPRVGAVLLRAYDRRRVAPYQPYERVRLLQDDPARLVANLTTSGDHRLVEWVETLGV